MMESLPIVFKLVRIPTPFLEASTINSADTVIYTGYADFIGPKSDNISALDMCSMNSFIFLCLVSLPKNPYR